MVVQLAEVSGFSVKDVADRFGSPTWVYQRETMEKRIAEVKRFDVVRYAQKACSNLAVLALMHRNGVQLDAVSAGEILRALQVGCDPRAEHPGVVYTADLFDDAALQLIAKHHVPVNCGSPDMLEQLAAAGIRVPVTLRINPGFGHGHSRKTNTGGDLSKHGIWHTQVADCVARGRALGLDVQGLHMHIGSGSDFEHLSQVCDSMVEAARAFGNGLRTISAGGGLPISYRKEEPGHIDMAAYYGLWDEARQRIAERQGHPVTLEVEPGRYLVAESGYLITQIRSIKHQGERLFYLVDAGFTDLVRPAFYGSHHHITLVPQDGRPLTEWRQAVVGGPLCESGDVFTQEEGGFVVERRLPDAKVGDYLVLHDAGAYGAAMSSNYNSRPLAAEVLADRGKLHLIRERQPLADLFKYERIPEL
jgi:diaminopimelate decarboxylase